MNITPSTVTNVCDSNATGASSNVAGPGQHAAWSRTFEMKFSPKLSAATVPVRQFVSILSWHRSKVDSGDFWHVMLTAQLKSFTLIFQLIHEDQIRRSASEIGQSLVVPFFISARN